MLEHCDANKPKISPSRLFLLSSTFLQTLVRALTRASPHPHASSWVSGGFAGESSGRFVAFSHNLNFLPGSQQNDFQSQLKFSTFS